MFDLLLLPNIGTALPSELTPYCSAYSQPTSTASTYSQPTFTASTYSQTDTLLPFHSATSIKKNCQKLLMELSEVDDGSGVCYLRCPTDPNSNQLIRISHPWDKKSRLARLPLAPWRPLQDVYLLPLNN